MFQSLLDGPYGTLLLLIEYGSGTVDSDFFAVYDQSPETPVTILGRLDLWTVGLDEFTIAAHNWDPFVTEPVLCGKALVESATFDLAAAKELLQSDLKVADRVQYLFRRSCQAFERACLGLQGNHSSTTDSRIFWSNLSYAFSYWHFAQIYLEVHGPGPMTLKELLSRLDHRQQTLWQAITIRKSSCDPPDGDLVRALALEFVRLPHERLQPTATRRLGT